MRILVAYGSKRGGTEGIARILARTLEDYDIEVEVVPPRMAGPLKEYDAVVVGGSVYMGRWNRDARHFVTKNADALRQKPIWLFSSGPLDDSATRSSIPPTPDVLKLIHLVHAKGFATFGGRLLPNARGPLAGAMARTHAGDWRDSRAIHRWALGISRSLRRDRVVLAA
jgi:menaquinone-dependent protoporphyrinogen oxidase